MSTLAEALAPRSDQLNADDLIPGPRVLKITGARITKDDRQTKIVISYEGDQGKPWKPCKTMGRAMVMVWSITDEAQLIGKSVRVYRDPEVKFGDQGAVGGIRISHMSGISKPTSVKLTVSQGKKSLFTFHPLVTEQPSDDSADTYTIDQARAEIAAAASLDELATTWRARCMEPHRPALQADLDARKLELSVDQTRDTGTAIEGEAIADRTAIDAALAEIEACETHKAVNVAVALYRARHPDHADELDAAAAARIEAIGDEGAGS